MIVKTFNPEIVKQPELGVMLIKDFTEPVYQKIGRVRALNFHANFRGGLNGFRLRDQERQRPGGILKHFRKSGAESFKSNVSSVLKNAKTGHGFMI